MSGPGSTSETISFRVTGMTCGSCVNRITRAIRNLDGVTKVVVDLRRETVTVRREPASVSDAALAAAVAAAGYDADVAASVSVSDQPREARSLASRLFRRSR